MSKIRESARGEHCTVRLPCCNGNTETTVLAHINGIRFKHGTGKKVNDLLGAYCCFNCHQAVDRRDYLDYDKDFVKLAHYEGVMETIMKLSEKGII